MRNGKPIVYIAFGFITAWVFTPVWAWAVSHFLDNAAKAQGGIAGTISKVLAVTAPMHGFVLGVSVGMLLAVAIGYWDQIRDRARYGIEWCRAALLLLWYSRPGIRRISHCMIMLRATEIYREYKLMAPIHMDSSRLKWHPKDKVYLQQVDPGTIAVFRTNNTERTDLRVMCDVWGAYDFWATLRLWWKADAVGKALDYRKMEREAAESLPSDKLPEFES